MPTLKRKTPPKLASYSFPGQATQPRFRTDESAPCDPVSIAEAMADAGAPALGGTDAAAADASSAPASARGAPVAASSIAPASARGARGVPVPPESSAYPLLPGPETGGAHTYCRIPAETFQVRGPRYTHDKVKVASAPSAFELMHVDLFLSKERIGNMAARRQSWLRLARAAGDRRQYLIPTYVTPASPFVHVAFYFAVDDERLAVNPHLERLWRRFTAHGPEADAFRNERWKVIPRIAEGSWVVQRAVGSKPALLGTKLKHTWILCEAEGAVPEPPPPGEGGPHPQVAVSAEEAGCDAGLGLPPRQRGRSFTVADGLGPYIEGDCDVSSSSMAFVLVSLLQQYAKHIVIDLAFAVEPRDDDELPEAVLGTVRLSRIDVQRPGLVAAEPEDWVLGQMGTLHGDAAEGGAAASSSS